MVIMKRFMQSENRHISMNLFADLCGVAVQTLYDVFEDERYPMSEYVQRRVSKGYTAWMRGEVAIMQNRDTSKFLKFRKESKLRLARSVRLAVTPDGIKIRPGIRNLNDYSEPNLKDQLEK